MRKFIYLFMFLFACASYAQTEQISGQFRLIGTQEQPQADKVLTIDDNGDVGYMNNNRASFARYRWTNPVKFVGIINFPTEVFNYNLDTERTNNNERIYVEEGYYNVNVTLDFEQNGSNYIEIYMNAIRIASNTGGTDVGTTVSTGVIYIGENDYISVLVSTGQNTENLIAEISFEKIK